MLSDPSLIPRCQSSEQLGLEAGSFFFLSIIKTQGIPSYLRGCENTLAVKGRRVRVGVLIQGNRLLCTPRKDREYIVVQGITRWIQNGVGGNCKFGGCGWVHLVLGLVCGHVVLIASESGQPQLFFSFCPDCVLYSAFLARQTADSTLFFIFANQTQCEVSSLDISNPSYSMSTFKDILV